METEVRTSPHIIQEAPSQRRHLRVTSPLFITLDGVAYPTEDWSLGGFCIGDFYSEATVGQVLCVQPTLNFQDFHIAFHTEAEVVRLTPYEGKLAARFVHLSEREAELLECFISGLTRGEMSAIDDVIARLDTPVTLVSSGPKPEELPRLLRWRNRLRRLVIALAYLVAGGGLAAYLGLTLYGNFFRLQITSAVLTLPVEAIASLDFARVETMFVQEGASVHTGEALLHLTDDVLTQAVDARRLQLSEAQLALQHAETQREEEKHRLLAYRQITQHKLHQAQDDLAALDTQQRMAANEVVRMRDLLAAGLISQRQIDVAAARHAQVHGHLDRARAELQIAQAASRSVKHGYFFDGTRLVGDMPRLTTAVQEARERVRLAQQALRLAEQHATRLIYRAPFDGQVLSLAKVPGSTVKRGETLLLLEKRSATPVVEAFLTQDEVDRVTLGSPATVYVPALDTHYTAQVVRVDRLAGMRQTAQQRYHWPDTKERVAYMRLAFVDLSSEAQQPLTAGLPAIVEMPQTRQARFLWPDFLQPRQARRQG